MTMFSLTENKSGSKSLAVFYADGDSDTVGDNHLNFQKVLDLLLSGKADDETVKPLLNVAEDMGTKMAQLSERVSVRGNKVLFDGDEINGVLTDVIIELYSSGEDFLPLVNFLEKASTNPSDESIDGMYKWISNGSMVIAPDGDIIAYKSVERDGNGDLLSISSGEAIVDGVAVEGRIPNRVGSTISMPRSNVDARSFMECSHGLHVGTYEYAQTFADWHRWYDMVMILVKFNPRDIVQVPSDYSHSKMRVCRYTVMHIIEEKQQKAVYAETPASTVVDGSITADSVNVYVDNNTVVNTPVVGANGRDSKGRFVKGAQRPRDSKGRFIK